MEDKIQAALSILNEHLSDQFPWHLELVHPKSIKLLEKNARYMPPEMFTALVNNIGRDGNLSSIPLCYRQDDDSLLVMSGNHRIQAACQADVEQVLVLVVTRQLSRDELIAMQLSHNAIDGRDDDVILKELWDEISTVEMKAYTGLDSESIEKMEAMEFATISEAPVEFKVITFLFLPEEVEIFDATLDKIDLVLSQSEKTYLISRDYYDKTFGTIVNVKEKFDIVNSPTALMRMVSLAAENI